MAATSMIVIGFALAFTIIGAGFIQYASAFVNIVSPEKDEVIPAGSPLTVSGTSDDNVQSNCRIQILVNDHRPYQDTIPVAPGDYSEWTFVVNPQYAEIEEGINTITSKAICDAPHEPFLKLDPLTRQYVKHYSINATGVPAGIEGTPDSEGPSVVLPPGEDLGEGGEEEGDEEGGESLFG
jgi:hypothetical protein